MTRIVWTFGLIAGAILSIMMVITLPLLDRIGFDRGELLGYTSMVAAFLLIYFGVRSYRDNVLGGAVSFKRAFGVGMLIVLIASVCYDLTWQVMYTRYGKEFGTKYSAYMVEKARASGKSQSEIDAEVAAIAKNMKLYENRAINFAITLLEPLPPGLVIALVSAGILSRRRRQPLGQQAMA